MRASLVIVIALGAAPAVPQSVSAEQENIVFADQSGTSRRLTATHLDSDPSLSFDNRQMVFVRRTPKRTIITALGKVDKNELCDFPGLGPHSFRRANITWRQEVGGSSIETSKIAGHSTVRMTEEYTKIQLTRQEDLTRRIQERLASVGEKQPAVARATFSFS
jgi:integrase